MYIKNIVSFQYPAAPSLMVLDMAGFVCRVHWLLTVIDTRPHRVNENRAIVFRVTRLDAEVFEELYMLHRHITQSNCVFGRN